MAGLVEVPSLEELNVPELPVGTAVLKAGAHHYGSQCDRINKEFMLCRWEERDPRKCLKEGRAVSKCAVDFFKQIKFHCAEPFNQYWNCLDESNTLKLLHCRKQQQLFDDCVLDKLGWVRPELGQLSKVTKVKTDRPLPENPCHSRTRPPANPPTEDSSYQNFSLGFPCPDSYAHGRKGQLPEGSENPVQGEGWPAPSSNLDFDLLEVTVENFPSRTIS